MTVHLRVHCFNDSTNLRRLVLNDERRLGNPRRPLKCSGRKPNKVAMRTLLAVLTAAAPMHSVRTPAGITLAESDHLRFAVGSDTVVRPPRPSALIRKRLVNRCERATPELVQIAAAHVILRGHLGYMLSPEQRHDSPHTLRVPGRDKRIIAHLR